MSNDLPRNAGLWLAASLLLLSGCGDTLVLQGGQGDTPGMGLRRITTHQYESTIRNALGLSQATVDLPETVGASRFTSLNSYVANISDSDLNRYSETAFALAEQAFASDEQARVIMGCLPADPQDACLTTYISKVGRLIFRRPLHQEETSRYQGLLSQVFNSTGSVRDAGEYVAAAMLQSPNFLYLNETGETDPTQPGRLRFTSYEMASRLAFTLWNETPDQTLLDAADHNELVDDAKLEVHIATMLADPRAKAGISQVLGEYFQVGDLDIAEKSSNVYPNASRELLADMKTEVHLLLEEFAFGDKPFLEILSTSAGYVNARLADFYGIESAGEGFTRHEFANDDLRQGVLTRAGMMALLGDADSSSATRRGYFVFNKLLCEEVGTDIPDGQAIFDAIKSNPDNTGKTARELREMHLEVSACASCHLKFDPIGFSLENFDGLGALRFDELGKPIDNSGSIPILNQAGEIATTVDYSGPAELGTILETDPRVATCFTKSMYEAVTGHVPNQWETESIVASVSNQFASNGRLVALVKSIVTSDGFRYAGQE